MKYLYATAFIVLALMLVWLVSETNRNTETKFEQNPCLAQGKAMAEDGSCVPTSYWDIKKRCYRAAGELPTQAERVRYYNGCIEHNGVAR